ncbi:hypothetical protein HCA58_00640 [Micromonospora sp. HNM0581]|uniref:hypothetical protein n=1 Tax=Micromonospora sp. HNM0581 TaxID=2716341 RepID=UPI00146AC0CC|nr:hypothetical protein [Micromonospora sp. HNM0581]NLU76922.1 hypothetical protein [Micromonospora sp. HNM0581]
MELYIYKRPTELPIAVAPLPAALSSVSSRTDVRAATVAARPWAPQVHRAETQAELILAPVTSAFQGSSGCAGNGVDDVNKRMDIRGVPPRGRPV